MASEVVTLHAGLRHPTNHDVVSETSATAVGRNAVKTLSAARVLFGAIFIFDGALKWLLFAQGQMQGVVDAFGVSFLSSNWVLFGTLVGLGETLGGICLVLGIFQRPAALWSVGIMGAIWAYGGYGGLYMNGVFSLTGQTDPGGDLMLALIFLVLVFSPYAYGLASALKLRERWSGSSFVQRTLRLLAT